MHKNIIFSAMMIVISLTSLKSQVVNVPSQGIYKILNQKLPIKLGTTSDFIGNMKYHYGSYTEDGLSNIFNSKLVYRMGNSYHWDQTDLKNKGIPAYDLLEMIYRSNYNTDKKRDSLINISNEFFSKKNKSNLLTLSALENHQGFNYLKGPNNEIIYAYIKDGTPTGLAVIEDNNKDIIIGILDNNKSYTINSVGMIKYFNGTYYYGQIKNNAPKYWDRYVDYKGIRQTYPGPSITNYKSPEEGVALLKDGSIVKCELVNGKPIGIGTILNSKIGYDKFDLVFYTEKGLTGYYKNSTIVKNKEPVQTSTSNSIAGNYSKNIDRSKADMDTLLMNEAMIKKSNASPEVKRKLLIELNKLKKTLQDIDLAKGANDEFLNNLFNVGNPNATFTPKNCWHCYGTGVMKICKLCDGRGIVYCRECNGRKYLSDGRVCLNCSGQGILRCHVCNGKKNNIKCNHKIDKISR
jgi:hypothetical protein